MEGRRLYDFLISEGFVSVCLISRRDRRDLCPFCQGEACHALFYGQTFYREVVGTCRLCEAFPVEVGGVLAAGRHQMGDVGAGLHQRGLAGADVAENAGACDADAHAHASSPPP